LAGKCLKNGISTRIRLDKKHSRRLKKDIQEIEESRFVLRIEQIDGQQRVESTEEERIFQIVLCQQNIETMQSENLRRIALRLIGIGEKIGEHKWIGHAWNDLRRDMQQ
jgi:predicted ribosome-associated RNA-binding protein Tma20